MAVDCIVWLWLIVLVFAFLVVGLIWLYTWCVAGYVVWFSCFVVVLFGLFCVVGCLVVGFIVALFIGWGGSVVDVVWFISVSVLVVVFGLLTL